MIRNVEIAEVCISSMRARYPVHLFLIYLLTLMLLAGEEGPSTSYDSQYTFVSSLLLSACLGSKRCPHLKYKVLNF
jgi:hypothetical protein